ncbi:MAG: NAD(P)/FAD-dependent oxidoreductase [Opitutales bacterium]|nr:NAD(P)/FAD-dependent oxidoreductase [Opitutales bacterium]
MPTLEFDLFIIGGGSGGYAAARTAHAGGLRVGIADSGKELGGLCILRGCMPSKTLIYSAEILHSAQRGKLFGLKIPSAEVDMKLLHRRKQEVIKEFADYRQGQLEDGRFTLFREQARFIDEQTVELNSSGTHIKADYFVIASGSTVQWPHIEGLAPKHGVWTSDNVLELDYVPESIVVLGGGVVACELAQFLNRIGSKVIQIQRSLHVIKAFSEAASETIARVFRDEGITLYTDTKLLAIRKAEHGYRVIFEKDGEEYSVEAVYVLNALGRAPATRELNLSAAGVETLPTGHIQTNVYQQTDNPNIYAVGDVAGPHEIVHVAIMQGETAANHALKKDYTAVDYDLLTSVVFTDPQVARAGIPETVCRKRGIEIISAEYPFDDHGKSILMEAKYGYVKVWAEKKTGRLLGAECVGKDAGELIHIMAAALPLKADVRDLVRTHWYHPTLAEIWSYPLEDLADELNG